MSLYDYTFLDNSKTLVNSDFDKVTFVKVVDGVTIIVNDGKKDIQVKLLCVNTEESDSSNTKDKNKYSEKASEFTKDYFKDIKTLYLQYDAEKVDTDGNTLAYVWLSDDLDPFNENDILSYMYNAIMLDKGMAYVTIQDPNKYYEGFFRKIEVDSFVSKEGLWKYKEYRDMLGHQ